VALTLSLAYVSGIAFPARDVYLTQDDILICKVGQQSVLDSVPLLEINHLVVASSDILGESTEHQAGDGSPQLRTFIIHPIEDGHNSGRATVLRAETLDARDKWMTCIEQAQNRALERQNAAEDPIRRWQRQARNFYGSSTTQVLIGLVIMASYIASILNSQFLPTPGSAEDSFFKHLEIAFTVIFALELGLNAFGYWMWAFLSDGWSVFDAIVVIVSIVGLAEPSLPAVNVLRLVRVFKMVRLFRKAERLRILINALSSSIVPVLYRCRKRALLKSPISGKRALTKSLTENLGSLFRNGLVPMLCSFAILLLVSSIYAVLATEFFSMDQQNFGTFSLSIYSLFQVL
jgi:hypothetical protein